MMKGIFSSTPSSPISDKTAKSAMTASFVSSEGTTDEESTSDFNSGHEGASTPEGSISRSRRNSITQSKQRMLGSEFSDDSWSIILSGGEYDGTISSSDVVDAEEDECNTGDNMKQGIDADGRHSFSDVLSGDEDNSTPDEFGDDDTLEIKRNAGKLGSTPTKEDPLGLFSLRRRSSTLTPNKTDLSGSFSTLKGTTSLENSASLSLPRIITVNNYYKTEPTVEFSESSIPQESKEENGNYWNFIKDINVFDTFNFLKNDEFKSCSDYIADKLRNNYIRFVILPLLLCYGTYNILPEHNSLLSPPLPVEYETRTIYQLGPVNTDTNYMIKTFTDFQTKTVLLTETVTATPKTEINDGVKTIISYETVVVEENYFDKLFQQHRRNFKWGVDLDEMMNTVVGMGDMVADHIILGSDYIYDHLIGLGENIDFTNLKEKVSSHNEVIINKVSDYNKVINKKASEFNEAMINKASDFNTHFQRFKESVFDDYYRRFRKYSMARYEDTIKVGALKVMESSKDVYSRMVNNVQNEWIPFVFQRSQEMHSKISELYGDTFKPQSIKFWHFTQDRSLKLWNDAIDKSQTGFRKSKQVVGDTYLKFVPIAENFYNKSSDTLNYHFMPMLKEKFQNRKRSALKGYFVLQDFLNPDSPKKDFSKLPKWLAKIRYEMDHSDEFKSLQKKYEEEAIKKYKNQKIDDQTWLGLQKVKLTAKNEAVIAFHNIFLEDYKKGKQ